MIDDRFDGVVIAALIILPFLALIGAKLAIERQEAPTLRTVALNGYRALAPLEVYQNNTFIAYDFGREVAIRAFQICISTFPELHVRVWLSTVAVPTPDSSPSPPASGHSSAVFDAFGVAEAGASGAANVYAELPAPIAAEAVYVGLWAHNTWVLAKDCHFNVVLYYEMGPS